MKVSEDIDVQMLNEFKQGRLEMLYRRLYPALLLYAVRYAGEQNSFLAEDCVQNAVFNAWKRRLQFESVESLKMCIRDSYWILPRVRVRRIGTYIVINRLFAGRRIYHPR